MKPSMADLVPTMGYQRLTRFARTRIRCAATEAARCLCTYDVRFWGMGQIVAMTAVPRVADIRRR
jgi:hypothetical protein